MWKWRRDKVPPTTTSDTIIGEQTLIEGHLVTHNDLRIEGQIHGDISVTGDVLIGTKGSVRSILTAHNVTNAGLIDGGVRVTGTLTITNKGQVNGEIHASSLMISAGGLFNGKCLMSTNESPQKNEATPTLPKPLHFAPNTG